MNKISTANQMWPSFWWAFSLAPRPRFRVLTKRIAASGDEIDLTPLKHVTLRMRSVGNRAGDHQQQLFTGLVKAQFQSGFQKLFCSLANKPRVEIEAQTVSVVRKVATNGVPHFPNILTKSINTNHFIYLKFGQSP